jgi:hypothetical protein
MANSSKSSSHPVMRLLFWEGLALAGYFHIRHHPFDDRVWGPVFSHNALFFLVAYPTLYFFRWILSDGCLSKIAWPVSFILSLALGASTYIWLAYLFFTVNSPYFHSMANHETALGILYALLYFPLVQPLLGVSRRYHSLGELFWILVYSALGGFIGYEAGWFLFRKAAWAQADKAHWFLMWFGLTLLSSAIGAWIAQGRRKG